MTQEANHNIFLDTHHLFLENLAQVVVIPLRARSFRESVRRPTQSRRAVDILAQELIKTFFWLAQGDNFELPLMAQG